MTKNSTAIDAAISCVGGVARLADAVGVRQSAISNWRVRGTRPNPAYCAAIERATGGQVTRQDLRPLDWMAIWPELAESQASAGAINRHALRPDIFGATNETREASHA